MTLVDKITGLNPFTPSDVEGHIIRAFSLGHKELRASKYADFFRYSDEARKDLVAYIKEQGFEFKEDGDTFFIQGELPIATTVEITFDTDTEIFDGDSIPYEITPVPLRSTYDPDDIHVDTGMLAISDPDTENSVLCQMPGMTQVTFYYKGEVVKRCEVKIKARVVPVQSITNKGISFTGNTSISSTTGCTGIGGEFGVVFGDIAYSPNGATNAIFVLEAINRATGEIEHTEDFKKGIAFNPPAVSETTIYDVSIRTLDHSVKGAAIELTVEPLVIPVTSISNEVSYLGKISSTSGIGCRGEGGEFSVKFDSISYEPEDATNAAFILEAKEKVTEEIVFSKPYTDGMEFKPDATDENVVYEVSVRTLDGSVKGAIKTVTAEPKRQEPEPEPEVTESEEE